MRKNLRRFMSKQSSSPATPVGFNPFAYQVDLINSHFFSQFSGFTKGLLVFLFICHLVITIFCSIILVLPYFQGTKRSQWIFRKLYIKTHPGANVYKAPLFWVNAGVLMTISQLISSVATQAYIVIWFKIANAGKPNHTLTEPTLGLMFMCEMLTYWGLMHCLVVAIYYDHETQVENIAKEDKRWTPSPTFINVLFLGFPTVLVIATVTLFSIMSVFHAQLVNLIEELLKALRQGSSDWDQLRVPSTSVDEKYLLVTQLAEVVSEAKIFGDQILIRVGRSIHFIHVLLSIMLALICITFLCFIGVFSMLVRKFQQQHGRSGHESSESSSPFRRWFKPKGWRSTSEEKSRSNRGSINRQFFHLLIRAVFIIIAMLTSVTLFSLWVTRTDDFIMSPYWRGVTSWVSTLACTWSSVPIAWQCWRLYQDQLGETPQDSNSKDTSSMGKMIQSNSAASNPLESEGEDIEITILSQKSLSPPAVKMEANVTNPLELRETIL